MSTRADRYDVAIVGNGVAGTACAMRLARLGARPVLIGPGLPVDRPPLTKAALATGEPRLLADEATLAERKVDHIDGLVTAANLRERRLVVGEQEIEADAVVLATGLAYAAPPIPGLEHAYVNSTPQGLARLAPRLAAGPVRVLIVGAGLIGSESAATLALAGHSVTVIDVLARPLDRLHDPLPALAAAAIRDVGVRFLGGARVLTAEGGVVETAEHGRLETDAVIAATGGRSVTPPGLELEPPYDVDAGMRVPGLENVYAVGDLALPPHARFGRLRFPHWDQAIGTGEQAAEAIAGTAGAYDRLPYWWSDIGRLRLAEVGFADAVATWRIEDGLHVGRDQQGSAVCVLVVDQPRRLREARSLVLDDGA